MHAAIRLFFIRYLYTKKTMGSDLVAQGARYIRHRLFAAPMKLRLFLQIRLPFPGTYDTCGMYLPGTAEFGACIIKYPADNDLIDTEVGIYLELIIYDRPDIPAFSMNISRDGYSAAAVNAGTDVNAKAAEFRLDCSEKILLLN